MGSKKCRNFIFLILNFALFVSILQTSHSIILHTFFYVHRVKHSSQQPALSLFSVSPQLTAPPWLYGIPLGLWIKIAHQERRSRGSWRYAGVLWWSWLCTQSSRPKGLNHILIYLITLQGIKSLWNSFPEQITAVQFPCRLTAMCEENQLRKILSTYFEKGFSDASVTVCWIVKGSLIQEEWLGNILM